MMEGRENTEVMTPAILVRALVEIRDRLHSDRLMLEDGDDIDENRWHGPESSWLVWYRRRFKDEWLFPPPISNDIDAQGEPVLPVSHQHAAKVYREQFLLWRVTRNRTTDRLFEDVEPLENVSRRVDIVGLCGNGFSMVGVILTLTGILILSAAFSIGASLLLTLIGTTLTLIGSLSSTGAVIIDALMSVKHNKKVKYIMEEDRRATSQFYGVLWRIGVISDRLSSIWTQRLRDKMSVSVVGDHGVKLAAKSGRLFAGASLLGFPTWGLILVAVMWVLNHINIYVSVASLLCALGLGSALIAQGSDRIYNGSENHQAMALRHKVPLLERDKRYLAHVHHLCGKKFLST